MDKSTYICVILICGLLLSGCQAKNGDIEGVVNAPDYSDCPFLAETDEQFKATDAWFENDEYKYAISTFWENPLEMGYIPEYTGDSYYAYGDIYENYEQDTWVTSSSSSEGWTLEELKEVWLRDLYSTSERDFSESPKPIICESTLPTGEKAVFVKAYYSKQSGFFFHYALLTVKDGREYILNFKMNYWANLQKAEKDLRPDLIAREILTSFRFK